MTRAHLRPGIFHHAGIRKWRAVQLKDAAEKPGNDEEKNARLLPERCKSRERIRYIVNKTMGY